MTNVQIGAYSVPVLLTIILMIVYKYIGDTALNNRWRPLIAIGLGIILSLLALGYKGLPWTFVSVIDHVIYGILQGASVVGLYEGQKAILKPRPTKPVVVSGSNK